MEDGLRRWMLKKARSLLYYRNNHLCLLKQRKQAIRGDRKKVYGS
jgi:hypothetical protein